MSRGTTRQGLLVLALCSACHLGWNSDVGRRSLPASEGPEGSAPALALSLVVPEGWRWYERGRDLIVTRDGVFLQNILVERICVGETEQAVVGFFPVAALSSKQWPLRTTRHLQAPLRREMTPREAADALLGSRASDPALVELQTSEVSAAPLAGHDAFALTLGFRLVPRGPRDLESPFYRWSEYEVQGRLTPYRSLCRGFVLDGWLYLVTYTAARRHYFDRDLETFEAFLRSLSLEPPEA